MRRVRSGVKTVLSAFGRGGEALGATLLIYHRVGGASPDERDVTTDVFEQQLDCLAASSDVVSIDRALDRLADDDWTASTVLTFDDGFADVYENAWPLLRTRRMPFVVYLCSSFVGGTMHWDGSTARAAGPGLTWQQLEEMVASGLCTVGNHTSTHCVPERLSTDELDSCTAEINRHLGVSPQHFAWTWGVPVPRLLPDVRERFRSAATGVVGRNMPGADPWALQRVPVRATDPLAFFRTKTTGSLIPERAYAGIVAGAKKVGVRA